MSTVEGTFKTRDGTSLYTKTWKPQTSSPTPIHLLFIHGFSDHINAYYALFPTLSSPPYTLTIHGFDQRGWGRSVPSASPSTRGQTGDTTQVLSDIHDFIVHVSSSLTNLPNKSTTTPPPPSPKLFLMGHSMGGAEILTYILGSPSHTTSTSPSITPHNPIYNPTPTLPISGLLLESPHITFPPPSQPSPLLIFAGRLASKLLPNHQMVQKLDSSAMCRDPRVCKDWEGDPLCHDTGTLRGLAGLLDRAGGLDRIGRGEGGGREKLGLPVFWGHGDKDSVCGFEGSERCYGVLVGKGDGGSSVFRRYVGGYHKLHAEPEGMAEEFASDVGRWILGIAGVKGAQETTGSGTRTEVEGAGEMLDGQSDVSGDDATVKSRL